MEHWSKTSSVEPLPLGGWKNKRKMEEIGVTTADECHFPNIKVHEGQKIFPVVRVPHGVFRRPVDIPSSASNREASDHVKSPRFIRNLISTLENGVNQKVPAEKARSISRAEANVSGRIFNSHEETGDDHQSIHKSFITNDFSRSSMAPGTSTTKTAPDHGNKYPKNVVKARQKVMEILEEFRAYCDHLSRMNNDKKYDNKNRVYSLAARMTKEKFRHYQDRPFLGPVPGVEIGDQFRCRMELNVVGLHHPWRGGIEYMNDGGRTVATSIVDSGSYENYKPNKDTLIYCGQGGHNTNANVGLEIAEDQKLEGGNLALFNSIRTKNPVRVIRGHKVLRASMTYFYDGLYTVEKMWEDKGLQGKRIFKFKLVKMPGQVKHPC
ncbi:histone-lysine N-methyltransferase, H3 lysine-9 specific SUVH5-like [Coffea eugenioides]|uniref:histone-lysine N-methyltransferase, H3 lysine-9 specific SUVH5-like n=1 Tax=Coffea eugenioides TaxID=49369 RepID=UPI000F60D1B5|nr:histone-lysine N-methyltransferase, H3 lysine-9 specific SUVH5-like [Coffea eugenioides]